ncbi:MAG: sigma-54-dependent Fis family transcriptional regulator [Candidatus Marinimicrobia bacterium]|jgi:DNA-binding NtrC family response regulator|nr:sigma-54-dependent Fis family transcriptional regulator [Candidatus Neomarinimicrobiota bacterium]MBT3633247.1 sigma-54-dependent Fis family transcriptional regulator [Candidatus Neomarinimicrobiota bacterium]MBT3682152.1 sigma-54-dependent Fis family transcriptional regulator [Candidatus Neomarinimicrobiota bacterium]MBT3758847.1 sigma-54-dependent Fis family transcriptional regulator [Candidatus Neomarinimicrobiota bacterium]MBT3895278.1 sigma-54-dependent Fis family transcriptional regula
MTKKDKIKLLVIEDDNTMRQGIQTVLGKSGYDVIAAKNGYEGVRLFSEEHPDLVISDLKLPGKNGMELLKEFLEKRPKTIMIIISAYGTIDLAVNALKLGAKDFITKPFTVDELRTKVKHVLEENPIIKPMNSYESKSTFHGLVGNSLESQNLNKQITQVAKVTSAVLITGESGTGKELIARAIHIESNRKHKLFLAINCSALTESLLESELFGHEKGAFTGAVKLHRGLFEHADGGTLFLDEVGDISQRTQAKLLRVLQQKTFQRVGGTEEIKTNVKIIAATNKDLKKAIQNKEFREDLYFRLNVLPLHALPLRERRDDIPLLIDYINEKKALELQVKMRQWSPKAMEKIQQYPWPGNVRELENFLERVLIFAHEEIITETEIYFDMIESEPHLKKGSLTDVLDDTEYKMIKDALKKTGGIKQRAARLLGIKTSTLYYKMEKFGIEINDDI